MNTPSTSSSRIEDFSLLDPRVQSDPREFYSLLHEQRPVYLMPEMGMYVVARYEDARAMVQDHETLWRASAPPITTTRTPWATALGRAGRAWTKALQS